MNKPIFFCRIFDFPLNRGWAADICENDECPEIFHTLVFQPEVKRGIRVHPVSAERFVKWMDAGGDINEIPSDCLIDLNTSSACAKGA